MIDQILLLSSAIAITTWLSLILTVYLLSKPSDWAYLPDEERLAAKLAMVIHSVAFTLQITNMGWNRFVSTKFFESQAVAMTAMKIATSAATSKNMSAEAVASAAASAVVASTTSSSTSADAAAAFSTAGTATARNTNISTKSAASSANGAWTSGCGILVAGITVQFISFSTNGLLAFLPTIVKIDPITRSRVFLIRWCEWIPLSGFMTFMSECIDVHLPHDATDNSNNDIVDRKNDESNSNSTKNLKTISRSMSEREGSKSSRKMFHRSSTNTSASSNNNEQAIQSKLPSPRQGHNSRAKESAASISSTPSQAPVESTCDENDTFDPISLGVVLSRSLAQTASCVAGILFPFCTNLISWNIMMLFSMVMYFFIFPRVMVRRRLYLEALRIQQQQHDKQCEAEDYERKKESLSDFYKQHQHPSSITFSSNNLMLMELERVQRRRFSYYLLLTCSCVWTFLVILYFINMMLHLYPLQLISMMFTHPSSLAMVTDATFDVIAKVIYMRLIIDTYTHVFDPAGKVQRQLHELRRLVSAIWESSSDVIAISVKLPPTSEDRQYQRVVSMLSPSFTGLIGMSDLLITGDCPRSLVQSAALMLEMDVPVPLSLDEMTEATKNDESANSTDFQFNNYKNLIAYYVDSTSITIPALPNINEEIIISVDTTSRAVVEASRIVERAWGSMGGNKNDDDADWNGGDLLLSSISSMDQKYFFYVAGEKQIRSSEMVHRDKTSSMWSLHYHQIVNASGKELSCEMKVSRHAENAIVAVVRDVTERDRRFEAERKAHAETLARQRDTQAANRFTRHEVKNGLLAGIELCDSMRNSFDNLKKTLIVELQEAAKGIAERKDDVSLTVATDASERMPIIREDVLSARLDTLLQDGMARHISELDKTLQEVLETTLTEAMSREVVHEVYVPRMERANICSLLERSDLGIERNRFPVEIKGKETMPELLLDLQLMNYIHRNAVSNACKYGKKGGIVRTKVWYDTTHQILNLVIANEPGLGHQELMEMGEAANGAVFQQGVRLQTHIRGKVGAEDARASSGDGAWIMQKCAMTLGGSCSIQFLPSETIFSFLCPAAPALRDNQPNFQEFRVPANTWGIAIDDSSIQRKLVDRILANVGVEENKKVLLGEASKDVQELSVVVRKLLETDDDSRILILMDENLDFIGADDIPILISGSIVIKELLDELTPEQERRILALIRSANDSAEEIGWYTLRSHGFFPKATMQRDRVREILAPLWSQRFQHP